MNNFAIYHQAYKNKPQTIESLTSFRKLYPTVRIRILSDGGDDYSDVASKLNCESIYDPTNIGVYCNLNPKVVSGEHIYGWTKEESLIFLSRIYDFCQSSDVKYILFTEDDVCYNKRISINETEFDLCGRIPANKFPDQFLYYLTKFYPHHNLKEWGCCAGNFIKRDAFIYCYENSFKFLSENYVDIYENTFNKLGWSDVLFNLIFGLHGMKYVNNPDYSETDPSFPIFHNKITPRVRNN